jgi:hypothetical protein
MTTIKRTILFQNFIFMTWFISRIMSSTNTTQKTLFFMDQSRKKRSNGRSHAKCENLTNCSTSENNILSSPNYLGNALKIGHIQKPRSFSPFCSGNIKMRLVFRKFFFLLLSNFFPVHSLCMYFNILGKLWLVKFQ